MQFSQRGEYALRALEVLALSPPRAIVPTRQLSEDHGIPHRFLEHILADLRDGGFLESRRGVRGGYRLARPAVEISVAEVVEHLDGPFGPLDCLTGKGLRQCSCADPGVCGLRSLMAEWREEMIRTLSRMTIADLSARRRKLSADAGEGTPEYTI